MAEKTVKTAGFLLILIAVMLSVLIISTADHLIFNPETSVYSALLDSFLNSKQAFILISSEGKQVDIIIQPELRLVLVFFVGFIGIIALSSIFHVFAAGGLSLLKYENQRKDDI